jgi:hypothetical protein
MEHPEPCYLEPVGATIPAKRSAGRRTDVPINSTLHLQRHNVFHYSMDKALGAKGSHGSTRACRTNEASPQKVAKPSAYMECDYSSLEINNIMDVVPVPDVDRAPVKDLLCLMNSHRALLKALQIPSYSDGAGHRSNLFNEMVRYVKYMWEKKSDLEAVISAGKIEL